MLTKRPSKAKADKPDATVRQPPPSAGAAVEREMAEQYQSYFDALAAGMTERERVLTKHFFEIGFCTGGLAFAKSKNKFAFMTELDAKLKGLAAACKRELEKLEAT